MLFKLYRYLRVALQLPAAAMGLPPHSCRFSPSCSHYCQAAISRFGAFKGLSLCLKRIIRCRPGVAAGHDPLPEKA